jgi:hypothetical protein
VPICAAAGTQFQPVLASDGAGGAVIAWNDQRVSPSTTNVFARSVSSQGSLIGPSNSLSVTTTSISDAGLLTIAQGTSGSAIVAWPDARTGALDIYANSASPQGVTPPDVALSYFVPQSGSLTTPSEGIPAIVNFRTCPNTDGTQVLRLNARLKVLLRTQDNTPLVGIAPENICFLLNGGPPVQGFSGSGDDSLIANYQYNPGWNCPDVRCVQADAPSDSNGVAYITLLGATPGSPGVASRDPTRKWGEYAGDVPVRALGIQLQGRLTSASANGTYTAHVRNVDLTGGRVTALNWGEVVTILDKNAVQAHLSPNPYGYMFDMDGNGVVNINDVNFVQSHFNHRCNNPNESPP